MPSAIIRRHLRANMSAVYHPILTWGRCSHTWGHGRPGCSPTWGHSDSACSPNVAPPPPVRGLPYGAHTVPRRDAEPPRLRTARRAAPAAAARPARGPRRLAPLLRGRGGARGGPGGAGRPSGRGPAARHCAQGGGLRGDWPGCDVDADGQQLAGHARRRRAAQAHDDDGRLVGHVQADGCHGD